MKTIHEKAARSRNSSNSQISTKNKDAAAQKDRVLHIAIGVKVIMAIAT